MTLYLWVMVIFFGIGASVSIRELCRCQRPVGEPDDQLDGGSPEVLLLSSVAFTALWLWTIGLLFARGAW